MEGPSSKEAYILTSNNPGTHSMDNYNHPAPPPPYNQPQSNSQYPHPNQNGPAVMYTPGVTVTQQPGVVLTRPGYTTPGQVTTTVVGNTMVSTVVVHPTIGNLPSMVRCSACSQQIVTRVEYQPTGRTHLAALLLCVFGCWPCVWIPYCTSSCQTAQHYCTNCGAYIGSR